MFNFSIISAKQPSVDPYRFYNGVLWTSFRLSGKFSNRLNANQNNRCSSMFTSLLNNHIKELNRC